MDAFGLLSRSAAGEPFRFVCAEAFGGSSMTLERRALTLLTDGTLAVAGRFDGLRISRDGGCNFEEHPAFQGELVMHVTASPDGRTLYVVLATGRTTADGGAVIDGRIHRSDDGARTFLPVGSPLPGNVAPQSLAVASSGTLYVAAGRVGGEADTLLVSSDGGETWSERPAPGGAAVGWMWLEASPSRPDHLVLALDDSAEPAHGQADSVWITRSAGAEWSLLLQGTGDLAGRAFSPDGTQLAVGGLNDGLWTVALDADVLQPVQVSTRRTWGLAWTSSGLFSGLDAFAAVGTPGLDRGDTLGVSTDEGVTMTPTVSLCDVRPPSCRPTDGARVHCGDVMSHLFQDYIAPACTPASREPWYEVVGLPPPAGAGGAGADAGAPIAAAGDDELRIESGCTVVSHGRATGAGAALALALAALTLRRRRSSLRPWCEPPSR